MSNPKWLTMKDDRIRHVWTCKEGGCKEKAIVSPDWYQDNGTPVCPKCDRDMAYIRTEVRYDLPE